MAAHAERAVGFRTVCRRALSQIPITKLSLLTAPGEGTPPRSSALSACDLSNRLARGLAGGPHFFAALESNAVLKVGSDIAALALGAVIVRLSAEIAVTALIPTERPNGG